MSKIPSIIERELGSLSPHGLDEAFMSRLAACADGTALELSDSELQFEKSLRVFKPRAVPAELYSALAETISDTPFAVDEKIVMFHKSGGRGAESGQSSRLRVFSRNIAAAAAVALLGSLAAFMVPNNDSSSDGALSGKDFTSAPAISSVDNNYFPATYNRNLRDTRDEGVIWQPNNVPHRVLRFTYMDRVTLKNEKGETMQVEHPRDEYVIIPEKID